MQNVVQAGGEHFGKGHEPEAHLRGIGGWIGLAEVLKERLQSGCRLRTGDTGTDASDDCVAAGPLPLGIARHRNGQIEIRTAPEKALRHDADDGAGTMLDINDRAEGRGFAAEVPLPETVTDECDFAVAGLD